MARDALARTVLTQNGKTNLATGLAINPTNGAVVAAAVGPDTSNTLFLYVTNTAGADKTVTVKSGPNGGAGAATYRGGSGDLTVTVTTASGGAIIGPLEATRFEQANGVINVDFQTGLTGAIWAYAFPERW